MNERIQQLAEQHFVRIEFERGGVHECYEFSIEELEQFAQLIVKECEQVSLKNSHRDDDMGAIIARKIKQHFGVEE